MLKLRLYVAGDAPNSTEARANLRAILRDQPEDAYMLEVVDSLREPQRAFSDGVIVTPTLVKIAPTPVCKVIGTLRNTATVVAALGLEEVRDG